MIWVEDANWTQNDFEWNGIMIDTSSLRKKNELMLLTTELSAQKELYSWPSLSWNLVVLFKACLHVPSLSPCPSPSPSKFIIVPMETDCLTGRMGTEPILPVKRTITIGVMLHFDRDGHGHGDRDGTCKLVFMPKLPASILRIQFLHVAC